MKNLTSILQPGDIVLIRTNTLLGRIICFIDNTPYNHAEITIRENFKWYGIGAVAKGIREKSLHKLIKGKTFRVLRHVKWQNANMPYMEGERLKQKARSYKNTPYDVFSLVFYQFVKQILKKWIGLTGKPAEKKLYCSEFAALVNSLPRYWELSPGDLLMHPQLYTVYVYDRKFFNTTSNVVVNKNYNI